MTRVLLIGPYGLGNVLMALPAMQALAATGRVEIEVACLLASTEQLCREVAPLKGLFARVHGLHSGRGWGELGRTAWALRRARFDAAVTMFPSARPHYPLANWLVGARERVGSRYPNAPWWHLGGLNTRQIPVVPALHDAAQTAHLLGEGLGLPLPAPTSYVFRTLPRTAGLVGAHPGCKHADAHKRWGIGHFVETLERLYAADATRRFRVFFGPDEAREREAFSALLAARARAPLRERVEQPEGLSLARLFDSIGECAAFVANDSGLMHIAAAQGVLTLGLFGPSDERRTGPLAPGSLALHTDIPCRPCHHTNTAHSQRFHCIHDRQYCLTELRPEQAAQWIERALASGVPRTQGGP